MPESIALERLCPVRSSEAARLKHSKPGYYNPPGGIPPVESPGGPPVIPPRSNRKEPEARDAHIYRERHLVECFVNKIPHYRRVFSKFEKLDTRYLGFLHFTAALIWLR